MRLAAPVLFALLGLLAGCASDEEGNRGGDLPQAQPAHWEGGLPGLTPGGPPR